MFDNLSDRIESIFKNLKGHGKLTEKNIEDGLKEVRMAFLEADVHYKVVKKFIAEIKKRSLGQEVMSSLTPGQQVIKIVNEELTILLGNVHSDLNLTGSNLASIMLVGLQGSGKTTTAGKLAFLLKKKGKGLISFRQMFTDRELLSNLKSLESSYLFRYFPLVQIWTLFGYAMMLSWQRKKKIAMFCFLILPGDFMLMKN